jgi:cation:H+ antiporter
VSSWLGPILLVAGLVLIVGGAEVFFEALLETASRFRISPFLLTVLVSGFELENLAAGIAADLRGLSQAAAGTFLGGTTFLALAVPGISALMGPIEARLPLPVLLWSAAAPIPLLGLGSDGDLSRTDGGILLGWFVLAMTGLAWSGRGVLGPAGAPPRRFPVLRMLAGLGILSGAGELLGEGLHRVVTHFDVSQALLGNTAVAATVEAEEIARVAVPAKRGRGDVAIGNILGTIAHFAAFNAGVIALVRPIRLEHASRILHLPVAAGSAVLLASLVAWRRRLGATEAVLLVGLYALYVVAAVRY